MEKYKIKERFKLAILLIDNRSYTSQIYVEASPTTKAKVAANSKVKLLWEGSKYIESCEGGEDPPLTPRVTAPACADVVTS